MGVFIVIVLVICMILWYKNKEEQNQNEQQREEHSKQIQDFSEKWRQNEVYKEALRITVNNAKEIIKIVSGNTYYGEQSNCNGDSGYCCCVTIGKTGIFSYVEQRTSASGDWYKISNSCFESWSYQKSRELNDFTEFEMTAFILALKEDVEKALPEVKTFSRHSSVLSIYFEGYMNYTKKKSFFD